MVISQFQFKVNTKQSIIVWQGANLEAEHEFIIWGTLNQLELCAYYIL